MHKSIHKYTKHGKFKYNVNAIYLIPEKKVNNFKQILWWGKYELAT